MKRDEHVVHVRLGARCRHLAARLSGWAIGLAPLALSLYIARVIFT